MASGGEETRGCVWGIEMKQRFDSIDLMKFGCACMIVVMHSAFLSTTHSGILFWPWVRVAVPLFFITSAWLFFKKNGDWFTYLTFVKRNLLLYLIWGMVSIPFIPTRSVGMFVHDLFLSGIWGPTWFIMALVISVGVLKLIAQYSVKCLAWVAVVMFVFSYVASSCLPLLPNCVGGGVEHYMKVVSRPYWSFPIGIAWCSVGYLFARYEDRMKRYMKCIMVFATLAAVALFCEWVGLYALTNARCNDVYFMLVFLCPALFVLVKNIDIKVDNAVFFRKASVVIFITHIQIISLLKPLLERYDILNILRCILPIIIGSGLALILMRLEKIKWMRWLRYAY